MRQDVDITNFGAGELSPRLVGRVDIDKYFDGCELLRNFVVIPQGGVTRRPGTMWVQGAATPSYPAKLIPFVFSTSQAFVIEFGHLVARFYADDGIIASGGSPVEIATPYEGTQLDQLDYVQSTDELYLTHPTYPTQILERLSDTDWVLTPFAPLDGPYLSQNTTATTLTPSGTTGSITIAASSIVGINATEGNTGQGFLSSDIGRSIRIQDVSVWGWCVITAVNSTTSVTATVQPACPQGAAGALDGTAATANWMLGKWCGTTGYPWHPTFWQQRLMLLGTNNQPNAIEGSVTGAFNAFPPAQSDGSVTDINALSWIIDDDQVNATTWVSPAGSAQAMQLGIGTTGGEQIMQAATTSEALTPSDVQAYRETAYGSALNVKPLRIVKSVLFTDRPGRKLHEWTFQWTVNGYLGPDMAVLAEHITASGIAWMVYQQAPYCVVWMCLNNGGLISLTYLRDQNIVAWTEHVLGGQYLRRAADRRIARGDPEPGREL